MRFAPKTEEQINEERLLPEGEYSFEVESVYETQSKAGNDMLKVNLKVYKPDGNFVFVTDYLLESIPHKLLHFFEATGLQSLYHSGEVHPDGMGEIVEFKGKSGMLKLTVQKSDDYPDKNSVKDYTPADGAKESRPMTKKQATTEAQKPLDDGLSDDIPF